MSQLQKIIKYLALTFAIFLIFSIISGINKVFITISNFYDDKDPEKILAEMKVISINDTPAVLNIDIETSDIIITSGETFSIETSNKYIECKEKGNVVYLNEPKQSWFTNNEQAKLIIHVPSKMVLEKLEIEGGIGEIKLDSLTINDLNLDLGAGKVSINNLTVLDNTVIEGGASEVTLNASSLNNLDLDMGIGAFSLTTKVLGNSKIDHGIGSLNLNLIGRKEDYQFSIAKGLGTITINSKNVSDETIIGTGPNRIAISGGVGNININIE